MCGCGSCLSSHAIRMSTACILFQLSSPWLYLQGHKQYLTISWINVKATSSQHAATFQTVKHQ